MHAEAEEEVEEEYSSLLRVLHPLRECSPAVDDILSIPLALLRLICQE